MLIGWEQPHRDSHSNIANNNNAMLYPDGRILVFCKAPESGKVKTRLAKTIGEAAAVSVHEYLARHCLETIARQNIAPIELWCMPNSRHAFFQHCETTFGVMLKEQVGKTLGERMSHAASDTLAQGKLPVIIGTDCPEINSAYLRSAFSALEQHNSVIGPAYDGGYVLIGLREPQPEIFMDMPWGSPQVFDETMARLSGPVKCLEVCGDIDYAEDLLRLREVAGSLELEAGFKEFIDRLDL